MVQAVMGLVTYTSILTFGRFTVQNNFVIGFGKIRMSNCLSIDCRNTKNIKILERKSTCRLYQKLQK